MRNLIKKSFLIHASILGILSIIFYREIFTMQFWKDDFALLYNLQNNVQTYYPYQYVEMLHAPFFPLFGTNPLGYFVVGLIFLFLSALTFYLLVYELFTQKWLAFLATMVYLTSPVGVDTMFMAMTFGSTYFFLCIFILGLYLLIRYYKKKKIIFYVISLICFIVSFELFPYRSFYLISVIMLFELLHLKKERKALQGFIWRQLGLFFVWVFIYYIKPIFFLPPQLRYSSGELAALFKDFNLQEMILNGLTTVGNVLFGPVAYFSSRSFYFNNKIEAVIILFIALLLFLNLYVKYKNRDRNVVRIFLFSLGYIFLTCFSFYIFTSKVPFEATFRYLVCALPAYSLLIITIYLMLSELFETNKRFNLLPQLFLTIVVLLNVYTTQMFISEYNTRAPYAAAFPNQMKKLVPQLPKNSIIYFQLDEDPDINYRLIDTYRGGHLDPKAYFAVIYKLKLDEVNNPIIDFSELYSEIKNNPQRLENVLAFKYDKNGLHDLTDETKKLISQKLSNER